MWSQHWGIWHYLLSSQQHLRQLPYGSSEVTISPLHPEVNHRSPTASGKAVPVISLIVDPKARIMVVVERAQAKAAACRWLQVNVLADNLQHRHPGLVFDQQMALFSIVKVQCFCQAKTTIATTLPACWNECSKKEGRRSLPGPFEMANQFLSYHTLVHRARVRRPMKRLIMLHSEKYLQRRSYRSPCPNPTSKTLGYSIADIGQFVMHHPRLTMRWP